MLQLLPNAPQQRLLVLLLLLLLPAWSAVQLQAVHQRERLLI
jgi:hypothetical protein